MLMIIVQRLSVVHQSAQCQLISALLFAFVGGALPWVKSLYHCLFIVYLFFTLAVRLYRSVSITVYLFLSYSTFSCIMFQCFNVDNHNIPDSKLPKNLSELNAILYTNGFTWKSFITLAFVHSNCRHKCTHTVLLQV